MIKLNRKASQGHVKTISANNREEYLKEKNVFFKSNCPQISIDISNSNKFLSQQFTVHSTASASGSTTTWDQSGTSSPNSKNGKNTHKSHRSIEINLVDVSASAKEKQYNGLHQPTNRQSASISTTSQQNNNQFSNPFIDAKTILSNTIKMNQNQNGPTQNKENFMPSPKSQEKGQQINITSIGLPQTGITNNTQVGVVNNNNINNNSSFSLNSNSNNYISNINNYSSNSNTFNNNQSTSSIFSHNGNSSTTGHAQNNTSNNSNNTSNIINTQGNQIQTNNLSVNPLKMTCSTSPSSRIGSASLQIPFQLQQQKGQKQQQLQVQLSTKQITQQSIQLKSQPQYDDENQGDLQNRIQGVWSQQQKQQQSNSLQSTSYAQVNTQGNISANSGEIKQIKKKQLDQFKPSSKERAITSPIGSSKLYQNANSIAISSFNFLPSNTTSNNSSLIVNMTQQNPLNSGAITPSMNSLSNDQKGLYKNNPQSQSITHSPLISQQPKNFLLNQLQQCNQQSNIQTQQNLQQTQPNNEIKQQQTQANQFLQGHKNISQLIQQQIENDLKNTQIKQTLQQNQLSQKKKETTPITSPKPEQTLKSDKSQKQITLVVGKIDNSKRTSEIEEQVQRSAKKMNEQTSLQEELLKIKQENEKLVKELTIYKVDRDLYEKEKEYMSKEREFFQSEKELLNKQVEELQNQIKNKESNEFSSQKTKEAESQFLKERIFQYEKRNKDLENEYTMNSKIYKDTITKNQEVFQKYDDLKNELDQMNQNYKIQATQLNSTQIELERLRLKSTTMEQEEEDLKQNLKNINDKLLKSQQEVIEIKKKNKDLQSEIDSQIPQTATIQKLESEVELWKLKHQSLERVLNEERMRSSFQYQNSEQARQSVAGLEIGYLRQNLSEKEKTIMELRIENERITQQLKNLEIEIQQKQQTIDQQAQSFQQNIGLQQHFEFEHQKKKIIQLQEEADQQFNQYIQTRKELEMKNKELEQLKNHLAQQKESNEQNELESYKKLLEECRNELGDVYQMMNSRKRDADLAQRQLAEQKEIMDELKNKSRAQETELLCLRETYDNVVRELEKTIKQYEQYRKVYEMQSVELHHKNREILELLQDMDVLKIKYEDLLQQQQPQSENTKHSRVITKMTFSRAEEEFNADLY